MCIRDSMTPTFDWTLPKWAQVLEDEDFAGDLLTFIGNIGMTANCLKNREMCIRDRCYGNIPNVLSELIRTAFIAPEGKMFAVHTSFYTSVSEYDR